MTGITLYSFSDFLTPSCSDVVLKKRVYFLLGYVFIEFLSVCPGHKIALPGRETVNIANFNPGYPGNSISFTQAKSECPHYPQVGEVGVSNDWCI